MDRDISYCYRLNRLNLLKVNVIYCKLIVRVNFSPSFSTSSPRVVQGDKEWSLRSVHHMSSLPLLPSHSLPLLQHGLPSTGCSSSSWTSPTWVLPPGTSSPRTAPAWFLSTGYSPSGIDCCIVGHTQAMVSARKNCSFMVSSLQSAASFRAYPPASMWVLRVLQGDNLPHHGFLPGPQGSHWSGTWSTFPCLTLVSAGVFLSHFLTLSPSYCAVSFALS